MYKISSTTVVEYDNIVVISVFMENSFDVCLSCRINTISLYDKEYIRVTRVYLLHVCVRMWIA